MDSTRRVVAPKRWQEAAWWQSWSFSVAMVPEVLLPWPSSRRLPFATLDSALPTLWFVGRWMRWLRAGWKTGASFGTCELVESSVQGDWSNLVP